VVRYSGWSSIIGALCSILIVSEFLNGVVMPLQATTRYWTDKTGNNLWSTAGNWDPQGAPVNGETLVFGDSHHDGGTDSGTTVDDIQGLQIGGITLGDDTDGFKIESTVGGLNIFGDLVLTHANSNFGLIVQCPVYIWNWGTIENQNDHYSTAMVFNGPVDFVFGGTILADPWAIGDVSPDVGEIDFNNTLSSGGDLTITGFNNTDSDVDKGQSRVVLNDITVADNGYFIDVYADVWGSGSYIRFGGSDDNVIAGTLYLATEEGKIIFGKPSAGIVSQAAMVRNGNSAQIQTSPGNVIESLTIDHGAEVDLSGGNLSIHNLDLQNDASDTHSSVLDTGNTTVDLAGGSIDVLGSNSQVNPIIKGHLQLSGSEMIDVEGTGKVQLDILASMEGQGFEKTGNGTLFLNGVNSFSGNLVISEGTLLPNNAQTLQFNGGDSFLHLNGGTLQIAQNFTVPGVPLIVDPQSTSTLLGFCPCGWTGGMDLHSTLNVVPIDFTGTNANLELSGQIIGTGGLNLQTAVIASGGVRLSGPDNNAYTGPTTVNCYRLELNKPENVRALSGPLVVGGPSGAGAQLCEARWLHGHQGATPDVTLYPNGLVNLNGLNDDFGAVTFNGGHLSTGRGLCTLHQSLTVNPGNPTALIDGSVALAPPVPGNFVFSIGKGTSDPELLINASLSGPAVEIIKEGPGTMVFGTANTYGALTLLNEGILRIADSSSLGSTGEGTFISTNATLQLSGGIAVAEPITLPASTNGGVALTVPDNGQSAEIVAPLRLQGPTTISVGNNAVLTINAPIIGGGTLTKLGSGKLIFGGSTANTYSGDTTVASGTLVLAKPTGVEAIPGRLFIGSSSVHTTSAVEQISSFTITGSVTVDRGGVWNLIGQAEGFSIPDLHGDAPLTLLNGGSVNTGTNGIVYLPVGGDLIVNPGNNGNSVFNGNIGLDPGPHHFTVTARPLLAGPPELAINGNISETSTPADLIKDGSGTLMLNGLDTYTGGTTVAGGGLDVEGAISPSGTVEVDAGVLEGAGSVGPIVTTSPDAVIAPHGGLGGGVVGPGKPLPQSQNHISSLVCESLKSQGGGTLRIRLNGPIPSSEYDQLLVTQTADLTGLDLDLSLNYPAATNDQFTIVETIGPGGGAPVVGTFNNLPEGATLTASGEPFQISYKAAGSTEVLVSHQPPVTPATVVWGNLSGGVLGSAANWSGNVVPSGAAIAIPNNGIYTIQNPDNLTVSQLFYNNPFCTISGSGNVTVTGLLQWQAGSWSGGGSILANGGLHLIAPGQKTLDGNVLMNEGAATWSGDDSIFLSNGGQIANLAGATFDCSGDGTLQNGEGSNLVSNAGLFRKIGGSNATQVLVPFNNTGSADVQTGLLSLGGGGMNGGAITVQSGAGLQISGTYASTATSSITGGGRLIFGSSATKVALAGLVNVAGSNIFQAGTVDVTGAYTCADNDLLVAGGTVNFNGTGSLTPNTLTLGLFGTLGGSNLVTVSGPITWGNDSTLAGSNSIIANGGLNILPGSISLLGRTLVNNANATWDNNGTAAFFIGNGAILSNAPGATFDCLAGGSFEGSGGSNQKIINAGLFRKVLRTDIVEVATSFINLGRVEVQSGGLSLRSGGENDGDFAVSVGASVNLAGGTHDFVPISTLTGAGDLVVSGGVANLAGLVNLAGKHTFSAGTANITGDYLCVSNTLSIAGATVNFDGSGVVSPAALNMGLFGTLGGSNPVTVSGPTTLQAPCSMTGSNTVVANGGLTILSSLTLSGRTLVNTSSALWSNAGPVSITLNNGAVLSNAFGATFDCAVNGEIENGDNISMVINAGLFRRTSGSEPLTVRTPFVNSGTVEAQSGTLSFIGSPSYVQNEGTTHLAGGSIASTQPLQILGGVLSGNGLIGGSVFNRGTLSPGNSPGQIIISDSYTQDTNGVLEIDIGGTNPGQDFDRLVVSNKVSLDGTLNVQFVNGYYPSANSSFEFLSSRSVTGRFAVFNYPDRDVGMALSSGGSNLVLQVVNVRPKIAPIADQTAAREAAFSLAVKATDDDVPAQTLYYGLAQAPTNAVMDAQGVITWTPSATDPATNLFVVVVTDSGTPPLSATAQFQVLLVEEGAGPGISIVPGTPGSHAFTLTLTGDPDATYVTEYTPALPGPWFGLSTNFAGANGFWSVVDRSATNAARFYRARPTSGR
jgi:fibronectin-binding autotransporter adhesin